MKSIIKPQRTDTPAEAEKTGRLFRIRWGWMAAALIWLAFITWKLPQFTFYVHHYTGVVYRSKILMYYIPTGVLMLTALWRPYTVRHAMLAKGVYFAVAIILGAFAVHRISCEQLQLPLQLIETLPLKLLNISISAVIFMAIWLLVWDVRVAALLGYALMCAAGYALYCVRLFRGTPLRAVDLFSVGTALDVASGYTFPLESELVFWLGCGLVLASVFSWLPARKNRSVLARLGKLVCVLAALCWAAVLLFTNLMSQMDIETHFWDHTFQRLNEKKGTLVMMTREISQLYEIDVLEYDVEQLQKDRPELMENGFVTQGGKRPNVIVIMNESLSDLQALWQIETNGDPLAFWHAMAQNTVRGNLYTSAYGGNTAGTEHGFLTGTMNALKQKTVLMQTITDATPSLAWHMKQLGYHTIGMHPYSGENYRRNQVYPKLGFDVFMDINDFDDDAPRLRGKISDQACYEKIRELYEQKSSDDRLFVFAVTMQNHGGYTTGRMEETIRVENGESAGLEEYLSLVQASDKAIEEMLAYFSNEQEPTVVLIFGDHQPALDMTPFVKQPGLSEPQSRLAQYITPFVIWSNEPLAAEYIEATSVQYLSALLLQKAGLPMTAYDELLLEAAEAYPVCVQGGYADHELQFSAWENEEEYPEMIRMLDYLRYNRLYDGKDRLPALQIPQP